MIIDHSTIKYSHKITIPLKDIFIEEVNLKELKNTDTHFCFKLINKQSNKSYIWKLDNIMEKKAWIKDIKEAIQLLK